VTHPPEVLAPAGDEACLRAAIGAGADAVYFGLSGMNARARATNFTDDALEGVMRLLHRHGVKGYVTLNTLAFDDELPAVDERIRRCAGAGVDAVIVQDLAVARRVTAIAGALPLHASTQMTCTDAASVRLAASLGARRVVLARELSLPEIAAIRRELDAAGEAIELEVFVHGALCVAYSGQCLTSEALGGRSANRGACAQACRLPYELRVDGVKQDLGERAYLLSPEDLEASALVPELARAGVRSLKIEGRLKGPEYVAATTRLYREAVDGAASPERVVEALTTYSRGSGPGFLAGIDHQRLVPALSCDHRGREVGRIERVLRERGRALLAVELSGPVRRGQGLVALLPPSLPPFGGRIWALCDEAGQELDEGRGALRLWLGPDVAALDRAGDLAGRRLFVNDDPALDARLVAEADPGRRRVPVDLVLEGALGETPVLSGGGASVALDATLAPARSQATSPAAIAEALGELGDTSLALRSFDVRLPEGTFLPLGALKKARRALVAAIEAGSHRTHAVSEPVRHAAPLPRPPVLPPGLFVLVRTEAQARAALRAGADGVYLDFLALTGAGATFRALKAEGASFVGLAPPRIRKPGEEKIDRYLEALGPDAILVRSLGALFELGADGIPRIGDFSLNVTNHAAAREVLGRGVSAFTPAFDLDASQLERLLEAELAPRAEVVVHHPMPLFHMEHCVFAALLSEGKDHRTCGRPCERHQLALEDRAGLAHPVEADVGCRNTVFHAVPQSAAALVPRLAGAGVARFRIELVRESEAQTEQLVAAYRALMRGERSAKDVWRELKTPGGYGVVRGSLRVLAD
jgi:putative protease